jgi:pimeloyl-ACP methyl ester carboxylesterase
MHNRFEPARMVREGYGPPLVLLHCLGVDHHFWDFATPLSAEFTLYRYDLPGHGVSATPAAGYGIADLSGQLAGLLEEHHTGRVHLAGISLGGLVAQHFAATCPELVDRLILIDTTPRYTDEMRSMWAERAAAARQAGPASLTEGLLKIWFSGAAIERDDPSVQYVRSTLAKCSGEGYALACEALAAADLSDLSAQVRAATLVICGDQDIPSFLDASRLLSSTIPRATLAWISQARHASVLEWPDIGRQMMTAFLKREDNQIHPE